MKYMLDTNICIFIIKNKPETVIRKFMEYDAGDICISAITYAELVHGVEKSAAREKTELRLPCSFPRFILYRLMMPQHKLMVS